MSAREIGEGRKPGAMLRYLYRAFVGAALALCALFGGALYLFAVGFDSVEQDAERRMASLAGYVADALSLRIEDDASSTERWLRELAEAAGSERITVVDSFDLTRWSSNPLIQRGDDIWPYVVDSAGYVAARREGSPRFSRQASVAGVRFRSLYYPTRLGGEAHTIIVEADPGFFTLTARFRDGIAWVSGLFGVLVVLLGGLSFALARRGSRALAEAERSRQLAFLGRMSAELAHELKNPLAIMKSSTDVLASKYDPSRSHRAFGFLSDEIMRLSRLVTDMLSFSREQPGERAALDVTRALREYRETRMGELGAVRLHVETPSDLVVYGEPGGFSQIADNLVRNAAKALEGSGDIRVQFEREGAAGCLLFCDSGPGVPDAVRERLFEPFVSGAKTGTGLGLAIVKALVERNGWTIRLRPYAPTTFEIRFPEGTWRAS